MSEELESFKAALHLATPIAYIDAQAEAVERSLRTFDRALAAELAARARHSYSLRGMWESFNASIGWRPTAVCVTVFTLGVYVLDQFQPPDMDDVSEFVERAAPLADMATALLPQGDLADLAPTPVEASTYAGAETRVTLKSATPLTITMAPAPEMPPFFDLARLVNSVSYDYPVPKPPQKIALIGTASPAPWDQNRLIVALGAQMPKDRPEVSTLVITLVWDESKVSAPQPRAETSPENARHRLSKDGQLTNIYEITPKAALSAGDRIGTLRMEWTLRDDPRAHIHSTPIQFTAAAPRDLAFATALTGYGLYLQKDTAVAGWSKEAAIAMAEANRGKDANGARADMIDKMRRPPVATPDVPTLSP